MSNFDGLEAETRWVPSTLRGFRQWRLIVASGLLYAVTNSVMWLNGRLTAKCFVLSEHQDEQAPFKGCRCGIYAMSFPAEYVPNSVVDQFPRDCEEYTINGVVKCGGRTRFGYLGFKTQHALIEAVHLPYPKTDYQLLVRELFKKQNPGIAVFSNVASMYEQYPADDFSSLFSAATHERMMKEQAEFRRRQRNYYSRYHYNNLITNYAGRIINNTLGKG